MTDQSGVQPERGNTETTMYRPTAEGGLEATAAPEGDYRDELRSKRWNAVPLENPEVSTSDPRLVVLGIVLLGALTFVLLVAGYGSGFWG
jgi:hypothetical protein